MCICYKLPGGAGAAGCRNHTLSSKDFRNAEQTEEAGRTGKWSRRVLVGTGAFLGTKLDTSGSSHF